MASSEAITSSVSMMYPVPTTQKNISDEECNDILQGAADVIVAEARAAGQLLNHLDENFIEAVYHIANCTGSVILTGVGKSGLIADKISATMASTGTPSYFVHATEAMHGDLGRIQKNDTVIILSNSGETAEVIQLFEPIKELGCLVIGMTSKTDSTLAKYSDIVLHIGPVEEAGPIGLVPTVSTTSMLVLGDALAVSVFRAKGFNRADYARYHPGGSLGKKLMTVKEAMRPCEEDATVLAHDSIDLALERMGSLGAVSVVNENDETIGIFTDGDLRRRLKQPNFELTHPVSTVMSKAPLTILGTQLVAEAAHIMNEKGIDQVLVVNKIKKPIGWLDLQDLLLLGLL